MELTWESISFLIFSAMSLGGAFVVVTTRNLFHAVLMLMLSLFGVAGLYVLLVAPFLAAVQVLVYIGAIAILMLFAIMLTRQMMSNREVYNSQWIGSALVGAFIFIALTFVLTPLGDELGGNWGKLNANLPEDPIGDVDYITVEKMGEAFVTRDGFVLPFEVASVLLTGALIGAIVIAREDEA
jgi:NADH-quinone oxidoreductase subunit J